MMQFHQKDDQKSEYQGKNELEHIHKKQQPDDVISSKNNQVSENQGKDALKESINNQLQEKIMKKMQKITIMQVRKQLEKKYHQMMQLLTKVIKK